jgi:predicted metal-dependent hydrolase
MALSVSEKTIHIDGIGEVLLRKSWDTRRMRLRVDQKKGVTLTLPFLLSEKDAQQFLQEQKTWIQSSLLRQLKSRNQYTVFTEATEFKTRMHTLFLSRHAKNTIKSVVSGDRILVWFPEHAQAEHPKVQQVIRKAIIEAWRIEAKKYLPRRVDELATHFNISYNKLSVKNAKTRWGSCSASNNINLNLQLMRLPDRLIDYIILHELTHTIHKNHQKSYWKALEQIFPGAKTADRELNKFHLEFW